MGCAGCCASASGGGSVGEAPTNRERPPRSQVTPSACVYRWRRRDGQRRRIGHTQAATRPATAPVPPSVSDSRLPASTNLTGIRQKSLAEAA